MLDVQIAGADAGQGDLDYGVPAVLQLGPGFLDQLKFSLPLISICEHNVLLKECIGFLTLYIRVQGMVFLEENGEKSSQVQHSIGKRQPRHFLGRRFIL